MAVCETPNSPAALRNTNKLGLRQFQRRGVHSQDWGAATHPGLSLAQEQHTGEASRCLGLSAPHGSSPWLCAVRIQLCPWGFLPVLPLRKRPKATAGALQEQGDSAGWALRRRHSSALRIQPRICGCSFPSTLSLLQCHFAPAFCTQILIFTQQF